MPHGAGTFTNTATACAELILDGGPMPKVCDTDDETVQFTPPPPQVAGSGRRARSQDAVHAVDAERA